MRLSLSYITTALLAALVCTALLAPDEARADAASSDSSFSPFTLIRGAELAYGAAPFRYEQTAPDSNGTFSETGLELRLRLLVRLPLDYLAGIAEYASLTSAEGTEEVETGGIVASQTLEPELARFRVAVAAAPPRQGVLRYRAEVGYRWIRDDFTRTRFLRDGAPDPGAREFVTERFHSRGVSVGAAIERGFGNDEPARPGWKASAEGEFIPSLSVDVENSLEASFSTSGTYWRGRAGLEWGTPSWGLALQGEIDRVKTDAAGPVPSLAGDVRLAEGEFRKSAVSLMLRLGAGFP